MSRDKLNMRQETFAVQYVSKMGNGTQAAIAAGYSPHSATVQASQLLTLPKVKRRIESMTLNYEITANRVMHRLDSLSVKAEKAKQYSVSLNAEVHIGKALGMFVERRENLNVDLTGEHMQALVEAALERRR